MAERAAPGAGWVLGVVMVQRPKAALVGTARRTRTELLHADALPRSSSVADLVEPEVNHLTASIVEASARAQRPCLASALATRKARDAKGPEQTQSDL